MTFNVVQGDYPDHVDHCDAYLITGSAASVYDGDPWISELEDYIKILHQKKKPILGICFGHQLIAQVFGGVTEKSSKGWGIGASTSRIVEHTHWMKPRLDRFSMLVSHQDQVTRLPEGAKLLASSDFCLNASYQLGNHILTFQGHPEFSKPYCQALMEGRANILGNDLLTSGLTSLNQEIQSTLIAQWMLTFLSK
ncbi:MAG TPA: GMP synthase [Spirochaetes bacterium]|nr:GMP synthase [Spirochaetota bacterium]